MKKFFTFLALFLTAVGFGSSSLNNTDFCSEHNTVQSQNGESKEFNFFPWSGFAPDMVTCPGPLVFNLASGECGVTVPTFGFVLPNITVSNIGQSQTISSIINSTKYCSSGQTSYRRTFINSSPTDARVTAINLGVYEAFNSPSVKFNFYTTGGSLLGTYTAVIPNTNRNIYVVNIPVGVNIKLPALQSYVMEVVTNAPHVSRFKMGRNHYGQVVGASDATIFAADCATLNEEIWPGAGAISPDATVFNAVITPDQYKLTNTLNAYKEGSTFPIGVTPMLYTITDAAGAQTTCAFSITVNEFQNPTGALACNDLVNVSLEDNCEFIVTPDILLEGDQYGCFSKYTVQIIALNGANLGNKVTRANIGQKLKTQVIGPNGNSCWGEIFVQDKFGPEFVCGNVYTNCSSDLAPGTILTPQIPVAAVIGAGSKDIGTIAHPSRSFSVEVGDFGDAEISDLNVFLDIRHANVKHLSANITSPDGVTVPLFFDNGTLCTGADMMATFDDEASSFIVCEPTLIPSVAGNYKPINPLSIFDGKPLQGTWIVNIFDDVPGISGEVNNVHLIFEQEGAFLPFPTVNDVTFTYVADNTYLVKGIDDCTDATIQYTDEVIEEDCASIYSKVIKRCWAGQDKTGNVGAPCCQYIYVYRNSLSTLTFPDNFDGLNGNPDPLSCEIFGDSIPPVEVTGLPFGNFCDNVQIADPVDVKIDICENSYKLLRTHKVIEWCSGSVIVHNQIIKVLDNEGPELICPDDITISTDDYECSATYIVPKPEIGSECSETLTYVLTYNSYNDVDSEYVAHHVNTTNNQISGLQIGVNNIKWTVTDACGNSSSCVFTVTVEDRVRPNAVCDRTTTTAITGNGRAVVEAYTFDDGSVDNCGIFKYEVRKMTDACGFGTTLFTPTVEFCCAEVNKTVMVELRVTDVHGNSNSCMVEVLVQDKLPPYITKCPADITLDCQADYSDTKVTGTPEYVDNCEVISVKKQDDVKINSCGVGTVTRTWTIEDKQGYKNSCVQVITLIDKNPFLPSEITWPKNYETKKCYSTLDPGSLPAGYDKPTYSDDNCSLVAAHYKDQVFKFVDGACEKVIRTWTVIDWCTYNDINPVLGQGWYEHIQIIKLQNDVKPDFEFACVDRTFPVYGVCAGDVDFTMTAIDDCPEDNTNLNWKYELYTETGIIPFATVNSNRFFRNLAVGKYVVKWTAEDKCGNRAFCTHKLNVVEAKKPTPYCISSLTTAVMNSNGTVAIWAKDYDKGASDNCTPTDQLKFTFFGATPVDSLLAKEHYFKGSGQLATLAEYNAGTAQKWIPTTKSSGMLFDCSDIPNGKSQEISLDVTVTDLAGNQDYCTIRLDLQDNSNVCPDVNSTLVALRGAANLNGSPMSGTQVILESSKPELNKKIETDANGEYTFNSLPFGHNFTVRMNDNRNILNGVSTLDLVQIQRHILGLAAFDDAKKTIAADADNNSKVTAADLVALRKVILGVTTEFPNGQQSWRFVSASHVFTSVANPFPFSEQYSYNALNINKVNQNFYAIKIGDVNGNATANANEPNTEARNQQQLRLAIDAVNTDKGEIVEVPIFADEETNMVGYQFTMNFDPSAMELLDILPGSVPVNDGNFGLTHVTDGKITTSWNAENSITLHTDKPLFLLKMRAKKVLNDHAVISLNSSITEAVSYDADYRPGKVSLHVRNVLDEKFELQQNTPNPFSDLTNITFTLPEEAIATITLSDITGKVIKVIQGHYPKGSSAINVQRSDVSGPGVIIYKIDSGKYTDTKKMIILE